jgi:hypothetical protein
MQYKIGDKVYWDWKTYNGKKGRVYGVIISKNPQTAPNAKYEIKATDGHIYYPMAEVKKA